MTPGTGVSWKERAEVSPLGDTFSVESEPELFSNRVRRDVGELEAWAARCSGTGFHCDRRITLRFGSVFERAVGANLNSKYSNGPPLDQRNKTCDALSRLSKQRAVPEELTNVQRCSRRKFECKVLWK